jgi:hypothetical protein
VGPPGFRATSFSWRRRGSRGRSAQHWHRVLYQRSMCAVSFVDTAVSLLQEHRHVGLPEVAEAVALAVNTRSQGPRQASPPQTKATADLVGPVAHRCSGPALAPVPPHERPGLVKLDHIKGFTLYSSYLQYFRLSSAFNLRSVTNRLPPNQTSRTWVPLPDIRRASSP